MEFMNLFGDVLLVFFVCWYGLSICQMVCFEGNGDSNLLGWFGNLILVIFNGFWLIFVDEDFFNGLGNFVNEFFLSMIVIFMNVVGNLIDFSEFVQLVFIEYLVGVSSFLVVMSVWSGVCGIGNLIVNDSGLVFGDWFGGVNCQGDLIGNFCVWGNFMVEVLGNFIWSIIFFGVGVDSVGFDDFEFCISSVIGECMLDGLIFCFNGGCFEVCVCWEVCLGDSG